MAAWWPVPCDPHSNVKGIWKHNSPHPPSSQLCWRRLSNTIPLTIKVFVVLFLFLNLSCSNITGQKCNMFQKHRKNCGDCPSVPLSCHCTTIALPFSALIWYVVGGLVVFIISSIRAHRAPKRRKIVAAVLISCSAQCWYPLRCQAINWESSEASIVSDFQPSGALNAVTTH